MWKRIQEYMETVDNIIMLLNNTADIRYIYVFFFKLLLI